MSIYRTRVETVLYVGVPASLYIDLHEFFDTDDANIDRPLDEFVQAWEETGEDEIFGEILDNASNLGLRCIVVYLL